MTTLKLNLVLSVNGVRNVESIFLFTFQSISEIEYLLVFELDNWIEIFLKCIKKQNGLRDFYFKLVPVIHLNVVMNFF